jgi:uncharacterized protein YwqG
MIQTVDELREQLRQHKLARWEEKLVPLAKPAIAIQKQLIRDENDIPLGTSKFGGNPDLPQGVEWSFCEGKALTFMAQFKLSDVAPFDVEKILPERGMLYFFYEAEETHWEANNIADGWKIIYVEDESTPLFRTPHPIQQGKRRTIQALPHFQITYTPYLNLPIIFKPDEKDFGVDFTDDEQESYWEITDYWREPDHHFGGNPKRIQHYIEWELVLMKHHIRAKQGEDHQWRYRDEEIAFIEREMKNWQFLFQIDTDDSLDIMWGDAGTLYICIPKESLKQRKFEDCWTVMQCS